jgi:hypothetical protein
MTGWSRLVAAFPPPQPGRDIDWAGFEAEFGTPLPADYKEFVNAYGHGRFNNFLTVYLPTSPYEHVELGTQRDRAGSKAEFLLEFEVLGSPSLPVDPCELLPAAGTDNGNTVYWHARPTAEPDDWTVAVDQARSDEWFLFDGGLVDFLVAAFIDGLRVSVFPQSLTGSPSTFTPVY